MGDKPKYTEDDCTLFSCDRDAERLSCTTVDDAVQEFVDSWWDDGPPPETVTVYGHRPIEPTLSDCDSEGIVESLLERLDEEYGDPEGDWSKATPEMREASQVFCASVLAQYKSWMCEQVWSAEVNVKDYADAE